MILRHTRFKLVNETIYIYFWNILQQDLNYHETGTKTGPLVGGRPNLIGDNWHGNSQKGICPRYHSKKKCQIGIFELNKY